MSASFETLVFSSFFEFVVGADRVPIWVHEAVIATQSTELSALISAKLPESQVGKAIWKDVDKKTFTRFAQFAYTGDYSVPTMVLEGRDDNAVQDPECLPPAEESWAVSFSTSKRSKKKGQNGSFFPEPIPPFKPFDSLTYPLLKPRSNLAHECEPSIGIGPRENIGEVLLIHASLYVLADKWRVDSLRRLSLFKLHQTLQLLHLDGTKVPHIVQLVSYIYSDERTPDLKITIDELRELICQYIAANAAVMSEHAKFIKLVEMGGAFVRDLWKRVLPRM